MLKLRGFSIAILAMMLAMSAHAEDFDYSHIDLALEQGNYGSGDANDLGSSLSLSLGITDNFYISGRYQKFDNTLDYGSPGIVFLDEFNHEHWAVNLGFHRKINPRSDLIAEMGYESSTFRETLSINGNIFFDDKNEMESIKAIVGLRTSIGQHFETLMKFGLKRVEYDYGYVFLRPTTEFGLTYKIGSRWALNAIANIDTYETNQYTLAASVYLGSKKNDTTSTMAASNPDFSYSYLQAGIATSSPFFEGRWSSGFDIRGSAEFAQHFYINARYAQYDSDPYVDLHKREYEIGVGFHTKLNPSNDFLLEAARGTVYSDCPEVICINENGYNLSIGIRSAVTDQLQVKTMLGQNTGGGPYTYSGKMTANIDISYGVGDKLDLFFDTKFLSNQQAFYTFGVRAKF